MPATSPVSFEQSWNTPAVQKRLRQLRNPWLLKLHFLKELPSVFFWGIRLVSIQKDACKVQLPFRWSTKNPFRSIYFATQAGAAELSTGLPALLAISGRSPSVSMLLLKVESEYFKKASTSTTFTCTEIPAIFQTVQRTLDTREAQTITVTSIGRNTQGEIVSETRLTWSFKARG